MQLQYTVLSSPKWRIIKKFCMIKKLPHTAWAEENLN